MRPEALRLFRIHVKIASTQTCTEARLIGLKRHAVWHVAGELLALQPRALRVTIGIATTISLHRRRGAALIRPPFQQLTRLGACLRDFPLALGSMNFTAVLFLILKFP